MVFLSRKGDRLSKTHSQTPSILELEGSQGKLLPTSSFSEEEIKAQRGRIAQ